jgi:hypothetical protein
MLVCLAASCGSVVAAESPLEMRVRQLEDRESIRLLLERYIELNESRDYKTYSQLFARNGELITRRGRATGPEAIHAMLEKNFGAAAASANNPLSGSIHVLSNIKIEVKGDAGTATSRWTLLSPGDKEARVPQAGSYSDKFVRENGEWKFQQRIIQRSIPVDTPAK